MDELLGELQGRSRDHQAMAHLDRANLSAMDHLDQEVHRHLYLLLLQFHLQGLLARLVHLDRLVLEDHPDHWAMDHWDRLDLHHQLGLHAREDILDMGDTEADLKQQNKNL